MVTRESLVLEYNSHTVAIIPCRRVYAYCQKYRVFNAPVKRIPDRKNSGEIYYAGSYISSGNGKRLKELTRDNTKCMVKVNGKTFLMARRTSFSAESHAAITQQGNLIAASVKSALHLSYH